MKVREVLSKCRKVFARRSYKDVLFRFIFNKPEELLQLYNAMNHTSYTNPDDLIITTMEDVIYIGMKNDLSFLIANEINLYEHQSTLNENMPLRGLLYLAKMYESYVETHKLNRYQNKRIDLPFPRFIVFYNGEKDIEEEVIMRLSDAFDNKAEEPAVECIAKFVNINYGHNKELMSNCKRLHDYSYFVGCVRKYIGQGHSLRNGVALAIEECIDKGILADVLIKHRAEVLDMFLTTFDKKMYEEAIRDEGWEAGREFGHSEGWELGRNEGWELGRNEGRNIYQINQAKHLKAQGISFAEAQNLMFDFDVEKLAEIYEEN